ncbi:hypothetical protein [Parvularcula lutaonensis]|uniref:Uncharacterized protein n=1 Tax=Parvularcula lutaonensis TaxID=491923 RepID=A0ABV7MAC5_9PROT|nr:hypothetical protein [Parvularcula lutaonensis]GGY37255.1 hypothetical protein GCM10007148_01830 [Parvularcula lutaonensis]
MSRLNPIILGEIQRLRDDLASQHGLEASLEFSDGEMLLSGDRSALLHVAVRILQLVENGVGGSHFTIDKAEIAPDSTTSLTIAVNSP